MPINVPKDLTTQDINHLAEILTAGIVKRVEATLPKEFMEEVDQMDGSALQFKYTVISHCSTGCSWEGMRLKFHTATQVHHKFQEVRIKVHDNHVFLCGVELVGRKKIELGDQA
jgi:hypothetical protein